VAGPNDSYGDDDVNYVIWDEDPTYGAAFANWRNNPNTGEIRGASVYMNSLWLVDGDQYFNPNHQSRVRGDGVPNLIARPGAEHPTVPTLTWLGIHEQPLCMVFAPSQRNSEGNFVASLSATDVSTMSPKQKVEAFLTHVLLHEIGHTLGLRHNFMGSAVPPSSSVMDYLDNDTSILVTTPPAYDQDAIKLLYGMSQTEPQQPFCTDEDTAVDVHCNRFDFPGDPFTKTFAPRYAQVASDFVTGKNASPPNVTLNNVLQFVRSSADRAEMTAAWQAAIGPIWNPPAGSNAARVDYLGRRVLSRIFLDDPSLRGTFADDVTAAHPLFPAILMEVQAELVDSTKSCTTRRAMVDILKLVQTTTAYQGLLSARVEVATERRMATDGTPAAALLDDLLARIDAATHPYFK